MERTTSQVFLSSLHSSLLHPSLISAGLKNNFSYCVLALCKKSQLKRKILRQETAEANPTCIVVDRENFGKSGEKEKGEDATSLLETEKSNRGERLLTRCYLTSVSSGLGCYRG